MEARPEGAEGADSAKWALGAALAVGLLGAYLVVVLFFQETVFGFFFRGRHLVLLVAANFVLVGAAVGAGARWLGVGAGAFKNLVAASLVTLACLLALDIVYSVYINVKTPPGVDLLEESLTDENVLTREWLPRRYFPSDRNFVIHKPGSVSGAVTYGDLYHAELMQVPGLADELLSPRRLMTQVDGYGFRDAGDLKEARILALGDSFVFGAGVDQPGTWVEALERRLGEPVHNLGVSGSGPRNHLLLLDWVFDRHGSLLDVERVIWLIFEGNDLEDDYAFQRPARSSRLSHLFQGTIVETIGRTLPKQIKTQSVLHRLLGGGVQLSAAATGAGNGINPLVIEGVRLRTPLYRSERYGPKLFFPPYIERAGKPPQYVLEHPNRRTLEEIFDRMAALAKQHGFAVTVLKTPSAARQYGPFFEGFPPVSDEPYFLDLAGELARERGFDVIDLLREMEPYAERELLFWPDDTHWNERGNAVAAAIIEAALRPE